ncbi:MAG TPA: phytanoyl-CoA dioxygenase family protein [Rhodothermales bacterium]|nr:phytanoyl-CoA dioxygenase family protein [Rhodothermales bacterium]
MNLSLLPTEQDIAFYRENGYWISSKIFSDEELAEIRTHHAQVIEGQYETGRTPHYNSHTPGTPLNQMIKIDNSHWADAVIARTVIHPVIGNMAAMLSGSKGIRLWHDQLLYKPSQNAGTGAVGWHQDHHYWQCATPFNMLTAWIALVDVNEQNGCMEVVPGSHNWGLLNNNDFFEHDLDTLQKRIEAETGNPFRPAACPLPAGAVSFHHCRVLHGSRPNLSMAPRLSLVAHLMPDGTCYKANTPSDPHMNVRLLSGRDGDPFAGPYFPMLWHESGTGNPWEVSMD